MAVSPRVIMLLALLGSFVNCKNYVSDDRLDKLEKKFRVMEKKVLALEKENVDLNERVRRLEYQTPVSGYDTDNGNGTSGSIDGDTERFKRGLLSLIGSDSTTAFYVYLNNSNTCINNNDVIKFDAEILDVGDGYSADLGMYKPPVSGFYVFTWTVVATYNQYFTAELVVNGDVVGMTMSDAHLFGSTGIHPATGIAVLEVSAGDNIYIRRGITSGCSFASNSHALNTFSGWRLS